MSLEEKKSISVKIRNITYMKTIFPTDGAKVFNTINIDASRNSNES